LLENVISNGAWKSLVFNGSQGGELTHQERKWITADSPAPPEDITPDDFYLKWIPEQVARSRSAVI